MGVFSINYQVVSFCLFILTALPVSTFAFGPVGHQTVGHIAQDRLSPSALKKVKALIGNDGDLASIANWADEIRLHEPKTAHWHFIDIPVRQDLTFKDEQKFCPTDDCIINQIKIRPVCLQILRRPLTTRTAH